MDTEMDLESSAPSTPLVSGGGKNDDVMEEEEEMDASADTKDLMEVEEDEEVKKPPPGIPAGADMKDPEVRKAVALQYKNENAQKAVIFHTLNNRVHITKDGRSLPVVSANRYSKPFIESRIEQNEVQKLKMKQLGLETANEMLFKDPVTGEMRPPDLKNAAELQAYLKQCEENGRAVFIRNNAARRLGNEIVPVSKAKRTTNAIHMWEQDEFFQSHLKALLPIEAEQYVSVMDCFGSQSDTLISQLPLVSLPVPTSNLAILVMGIHLPPVSDSFVMLRNLNHTIRHIFLNDKNYPPYKNIGFNWLRALHAKKQLTQPLLEGFVKQLVIKKEKELYVKKNEVVPGFRVGMFSQDTIDKLYDATETLEVAPSPFDPEGKGIQGALSHINDTFQQERDKMCNQIFEEINPHNLKEWGAAPETVKIFNENMARYSVLLINTYELQIIHLLGLSFRYADQLITPLRQVIPAEIRNDVLAEIHTGRLFIFNARSWYYGHKKWVTPGNQKEIQQLGIEIAKTAQGYILPQEINWFIEFLCEHDALTSSSKTEEEWEAWQREGLERMENCFDEFRADVLEEEYDKILKNLLEDTKLEETIKEKLRQDAAINKARFRQRRTPAPKPVEATPMETTSSLPTPEQTSAPESDMK